MIRISWVAVLVLGLIFLGSSGAAAFEPAPGTFLVASKEMADTRFAQAVILLIEHDSEGSMGLIVNRPSRLNVSQILPGLESKELIPDILFYGGPVDNETLSVLLNTADPPKAARQVLEEVHLIGLGGYLLRLFSAKEEREPFRIYSGYAGWAPDQLRREILRGDWQVVPAQADQVFTDEYEGLWERLRETAPPLFVLAGS